jgi:hypothetical protein
MKEAQMPQGYDFLKENAYSPVEGRKDLQIGKNLEETIASLPENVITGVNNLFVSIKNWAAKRFE